MTEHKIITRAEAKARGLKRYFTGKPCKHGHVAERLVSSGNCMKCLNERTREWMREKRANDPEWVARERERTREWRREKYATDPEWAARVRERKREKRANDPEWAARERERTRERQREKRASDPEWAARRREWTREWKREKMAAGLCTCCGKEPAVTKWRCWTCADKDNARSYML